MNKRKIAMMIAGALSIITVFLPYFMVESETILSGIPIMSTTPKILIMNFSGVAIFVSGLVIIGFVVDKLKKGVIAASAINLACLFWGYIEMARMKANLETAAVVEEKYIEIKNSIGLCMLFVTAAAVIGAAIWYALKNDE